MGRGGGPDSVVAAEELRQFEPFEVVHVEFEHRGAFDGGRQFRRRLVGVYLLGRRVQVDTLRLDEVFPRRVVGLEGYGARVCGLRPFAAG